jgi:FkbM family methyltransferase
MQILCQNIKLNKAEDVIIPLNVALSSKTGIQTLHYSNLDPGTAFHQLGDNLEQMLVYDFDGRVEYNDAGEIRLHKGKPRYKQRILAFTLDDLISVFKLPFPNYIKIDVDGHEAEVLEGAKNTLQDARLKSVLVEGKGPDEYLPLLKGFSLEGEYRRGDNANFLFERGVIE